MKKNYKTFNSICSFLTIIFIVGSYSVWKTPASPHQIAIPVTEVREKIAVEVVEEKTEETIEKEVEIKKIVERPKEINLDVPFTSQAPEFNWDQPWQDACEEAAILMLDAYYKDYGISPIFARDEMLKMIDWESERSWGYSISMAKLAMVYNFYSGSSGTILEDPTIEQIKDSIANGHPVLIVAYGKELPNPYFSEGGPEYHALIIRGYTEDSFITNDPGTKRGKNFVYKYNDLMNTIHDWNGGDVQEGNAVAFVHAG
jgi:hypothetical protein